MFLPKTLLLLWWTFYLWIHILWWLSNFLCLLIILLIFWFWEWCLSLMSSFIERIVFIHDLHIIYWFDRHVNLVYVFWICKWFIQNRFLKTWYDIMLSIFTLLIQILILIITALYKFWAVSATTISTSQDLLV